MECQATNVNYKFALSHQTSTFSRCSQPPLLSAMVRVVYEATNDTVFLADQYDALKTEHAFWTRAPIQVGSVAPVCIRSIVNGVGFVLPPPLSCWLLFSPPPLPKYPPSNFHAAHMSHRGLGPYHSAPAVRR